MIRKLTAEYTSFGKDVFVYGASFGELVPKPETTGLNILVLHEMIVHNMMYPGQQCYEAATFLRNNPAYDLILCADAHQKFIYTEKGRIICNTGPMLRSTAKEIDHTPCFFMYDTITRKLTEHEIPHLPASEVMSIEHLEAKERNNEMMESFVSAIQSDVEYGVGFESNLEKFCAANEIGDDVKNLLGEVMK